MSETDELLQIKDLLNSEQYDKARHLIYYSKIAQKRSVDDIVSYQKSIDHDKKIFHLGLFFAVELLSALIMLYSEEFRDYINHPTFLNILGYILSIAAGMVGVALIGYIAYFIAYLTIDLALYPNPTKRYDKIMNKLILIAITIGVGLVPFFLYWFAATV